MNEPISEPLRMIIFWLLGVAILITFISHPSKDD